MRGLRQRRETCVPHYRMFLGHIHALRTTPPSFFFPALFPYAFLPRVVFEAGRKRAKQNRIGRDLSGRDQSGRDQSGRDQSGRPKRAFRIIACFLVTYMHYGQHHRPFFSLRFSLTLFFPVSSSKQDENVRNKIEAGGTKAGGTKAGGTKAGGTKAGGTEAGGTKAAGRNRVEKPGNKIRAVDTRTGTKAIDRNRVEKPGNKTSAVGTRTVTKATDRNGAEKPSLQRL